MDNQIQGSHQSLQVPFSQSQIDVIQHTAQFHQEGGDSLDVGTESWPPCAGGCLVSTEGSGKSWPLVLPWQHRHCQELWLLEIVVKPYTSSVFLLILQLVTTSDGL